MVFSNALARTLLSSEECFGSGIIYSLGLGCVFYRDI